VFDFKIMKEEKVMKKDKTVIFAAAALMILASFVAIPKAKADGLAPGEGYYAGAFLGFGMGILQAKVNNTSVTNESLTRNLQYETDRGGFGLSGIQGGGWFGWGMKTADDIYFGAEITGAGSDEKIELTTNGITASSSSGNNGAAITSISAQRTWTAGGALRIGYYVNPDTLFSVKGGVAVSEFAVDIGSSSENYYAGGPQVGVSVETRMSKLDPNLSVRFEGVYTDYLTADVLGQAGVGDTTGSTGHDTELTGHDMAARLGLQYSF
jgi:hypothetical protein